MKLMKERTKDLELMGIKLNNIYLKSLKGYLQLGSCMRQRRRRCKKIMRRRFVI
jgi:uncharacterized protein YqgQ